jgi:lathosterol oxidase
MTSIPGFVHVVATVFPLIFAVEAGRYMIAAGLMSLVLWAFWSVGLKARKIQVRTAGPGDYRREVLASLRTALIFALTGFGMYLASKAGWLRIYPDMSLRGPAYFAISLLAMIVGHDTYFYWTHRAMHHPRLFRLFHWTHHKSKAPTPWAAYAFDPPEAMVTVAFVPLWVVLVPMHEAALLVFVTWQIVRNVMGHAGVELSPVSGKPSRLFGWLNTTTHHDLHHQNGRTNYALYFTWWDRLMGTEHPDYQARIAEVATRGRSDRRPPTEPLKVTSLLLLGAACAGGVMLSATRAQASSNIGGRWASQGFGSIVELRPCPGPAVTMCGRILWLWQERTSTGHPRTDAHNPDPALRSRALVGIEIVRDLRETAAGVWSDGTIYNPDDGRTYTGAIRLRNGTLELRGCALNVFCQTQTWRRPEDVIAAAGLAGR